MPADGKTIAERVAGALGPGAATDNPETLAAFALDGTAPRAAAFPETPGQAAELLALANGERWGVVPWGGGHGAGCGNPPARYDLALSTSRLVAITEHDADNLTLTAQAGTPLGEVNRQIRPARQVLPLGWEGERGTLGGIIAANRPVLRRLAYGDVRDVLLGVGVALPDGSLVRYGRKVIKNVAGYDMNKLFLGSRGLYGVVVEAIFRLAALPDAQGCLWGVFPGPAPAGQAAAELLASVLRPASLFLLDAGAAGRLAPSLGMAPPGEGLVLLAGFEGRAVTLRRQLADAQAILERHGAADCHTPPAAPPEAEAFLTAPWAPAAGGAPQPSPNADGGAGLAIGVPMSRAAAVLAEAGEALAGMGLPARGVADVAAGAIRLALPPPPAEALPALAGWIEGLRETLAPARGFLVLQAGPLALKQRVDVWGGLGGEGEIMARLKARFDPNHILAPGRFLPNG